MLTNQVLQCFSEKCLTEIPIQFFRHVQWLRTQNMIILQCFPLHKGSRCCLRIIYFTLISTISFSFRLVRTLQSKHRSVHSSPANPGHLTQFPLTSFQKSPVHCAFSPKITVQFHAVHAITFHMVQFIITRQVLTLATGITRLWTGKRGEEKGRRFIGFFLLFLSAVNAEAGNRTVRGR